MVAWSALTLAKEGFTVLGVAVIAYLLVLVAIAVRSLRAARLPPAEAVRISE